MMLSRSAERVYWTGRYLERAENTARIVQQHTQLMLDLPDSVGVGWDQLVRIVGAEPAFRASGREATESDTLPFLLSDPDSVVSLVFSLRCARENIRNTRDLLPQESWESVNELYRFARDALARATDDEDRFDIIDECIGRCQQINGILNGTMSHHEPYRFLMLGKSIERADMTSRIIEVAAAYIQQNERVVRRFGSSLWTNVLKSVSGFQMYRQFRQPQVIGIEVIDFLLRDRAFPRAIGFCADVSETSASRLPSPEATRSAISDVQELLHPVPKESITAADVSQLMDTVQARLGKVHVAVAETWFLPGDA